MLAPVRLYTNSTERDKRMADVSYRSQIESGCSSHTMANDSSDPEFTKTATNNTYHCTIRIL